jgi:hypothetical protein
MAEQQGRSEPPTFFANVATVHVAVDEVSLEFRRFMPAHREIWKETEGGKKPPRQPIDDDVYSVEPIVKVVLTFSGAKALFQNLDTLLPQIEKLRKEG